MGVSLLRDEAKRGHGHRPGIDDFCFFHFQGALKDLFGGLTEDEGEKTTQTINTIEALGLPLAVIYAPGYFRQAELSTLKDEMAVIGDIFGQKEKVLVLADYLTGTEKLIRERTADINDVDKALVLYLGLNPDLRKQGSAGAVFGVNTPESYIIESVAGAKNAFSGQGLWRTHEHGTNLRSGPGRDSPTYF
jgi:ABC-type Fe3+-hydroxamate transport system substrate-binding protein